jgi:heme/copper-type cytochrome/quinol oxidase subunit 3
MNQKALDVSALPECALDHRSTIWWGNTWLLVIETTMFALLVASYLYVRLNFPAWPPPLTTRSVPVANPVPLLTLPTIVLGVLIVSLIPAYIADRVALAMKERTVRLMFAALVALGVLAAILRFREFPSLQFSWNDNAYASICWTIVAMHLLHIIVATAENTAMLLWALTHSLDRKHARDVRVSAAYWYWVVGIWILLYLLIYLGPRFI